MAFGSRLCADRGLPVTRVRLMPSLATTKLEDKVSHLEIQLAEVQARSAAAESLVDELTEKVAELEDEQR